MTRQETIYSNLELHCWLNLLCYFADGETKQDTSPSSGGWINQAEQKASTGSLTLLYGDPGEGQYSIKPSRAWGRSALRASLNICPFQ